MKICVKELPIEIIIGSCYGRNGLLSFGTKSLSEPVRTCCQFDHKQKLYRHSNQNTNVFFKEFDSVICKFAAILSRGNEFVHRGNH